MDETSDLIFRFSYRGVHPDVWIEETSEGVVCDFRRDCSLVEFVVLRPEREPDLLVRFFDGSNHERHGG